MSVPRNLARLRKVCLALPDAHEVEAWEHPTFRIRNKIFCVWGGYAEDPNITLKVGKPALGIFLEDNFCDCNWGNFSEELFFVLPERGNSVIDYPTSRAG